MISKKGIEWSLSTVAIAMLVLIILVVLILVFSGFLRDKIPIFKSCEAMQGECKPSNDCKGIGKEDQKICPISGEVCCIQADFGKEEVKK